MYTLYLYLDIYANMYIIYLYNRQIWGFQQPCIYRIYLLHKCRQQPCHKLYPLGIPLLRHTHHLFGCEVQIVLQRADDSSRVLGRLEAGVMDDEMRCCLVRKGQEFPVSLSPSSHPDLLAASNNHQEEFSQ